jgi:tRNA 5-methylaminomethyl-2-thiouridine biosynthesis bifunctional protein
MLWAYVHENPLLPQGCIVALKPARLQWSDDGRLVNLDYDDVYFQSGQALAESDYVFLQHNNLPARFAAPDLERFDIGELGFGSGLNFLLSAKLFLETAPPDAVLTYVSIEKHPIPADMLATVYAHWPALVDISDALLAAYPPLLEGFHTLRLMQGRIRLILCFGDVKTVLPDLHGLFDAWYSHILPHIQNPAAHWRVSRSQGICAVPFKHWALMYKKSKALALNGQ